MAVARAALPLPVVFKVKVAVCALGAPSLVVLPVSERVTVAVSLSVTFTVPLPVELTEALLLAPVRLELNDSRQIGSASCREGAVIEVVARLVEKMANEAVLAV